MTEKKQLKKRKLKGVFCFSMDSSGWDFFLYFPDDRLCGRCISGKNPGGETFWILCGKRHIFPDLTGRAD